MTKARQLVGKDSGILFDFYTFSVSNLLGSSAVPCTLGWVIVVVKAPIGVRLQSPGNHATHRPDPCQPQLRSGRYHLGPTGDLVKKRADCSARAQADPPSRSDLKICWGEGLIEINSRITK